MSAHANPDALVSTQYLADHLGDTSIAIVEVDEDTSAYEKGHIPGAVSLDWETELHAAPRRDFVSGDALAALLGGKGVGDGTAIVLYGGNNNWFAAYAFWLCRYRGIDNVTLLDGGRAKWDLEGRPFTQDWTRRDPATLSRGADRPELRAFRDDAIRVADAGGQLVDVRAPAEFSGELMAPAHLPQEQAQVPGHIPGALNVPWSKAANEDGTFRGVDDLRALYGTLDADQPVTAYCRIGERSAHTWFALTQLLGYTDVRNYDGSWTEYGSLVGVPVEVGS
ncbi:MAG: sulfurtransferase [Pseudonocardia sp.]|nr:sulfurtransferase [Pseudonocardia sp.]